MMFYFPKATCERYRARSTIAKVCSGTNGKRGRTAPVTHERSRISKETSRSFSGSTKDLVELFDLAQDIGEQKNLAASMPERTKSMQDTVLRIESEQGNLREKGFENLQKRLQKKATRKAKK